MTHHIRHTISALWDNGLARYSIILCAGAFIVYRTMEALRGFAFEAMGGAL
jgi:hypothetical protein